MDNEKLLKFILVVICFFNTFYAKYGLARGKRDRNILSGAMGLTVAADFFMLMLNKNIIGTVLFCAVQGTHNFRYTSLNRVISQIIVGGIVFLIALPLTGFNYLVALGAAYAVFSLYSLTGAVMAYNKYPDPNNVLIVTGMALFMLCDVFVMLYNAPVDFFRQSGVNSLVEKCIWLCYLPAQVLLSSSARKITKEEDYSFTE